MVADSVLITFHICSTLIWSPGKHLFIIQPYEYSLYLPVVMSFHLEPELPHLGHDFCYVFLCEGKESNLIILILFHLCLFYLSF